MRYAAVWVDGFMSCVAAAYLVLHWRAKVARRHMDEWLRNHEPPEGGNRT